MKVFGLSSVIDDIWALRSKHNPFLEHYETVNTIVIEKLTANEPITIGTIKITPVKVEIDMPNTIFVFEENDRKVLYAPCDVKQFPINNPLLKNADLLILGDVIPPGPLKDGYIVPENNRLLDEMFTLEGVVQLKQQIQANSVLVTHIEEEWGKSFDDYKQLEKQYKSDNITFAFDGMRIQL